MVPFGLSNQHIPHIIKVKNWKTALWRQLRKSMAGNRGLFEKFSGKITNITQMNGYGYGGGEGCFVMFTLQNKEGEVVNFIATPETYTVNSNHLNIGEQATGFYDMQAPTVLIFPPQYHAVVLAGERMGENIAVDYFDWNLISGDRTLKINPSRRTQIFMENGLPFGGSITDRNLIVIYGPSTRSIPAQTTPERIIVMC